MKRLLSLVIVLALVLGVLASCDLPFDLPFLGGNEEADIQEVVDMLDDMYEDDNGKSLTDGYELVSQYKLGTTVFTITWTSDNADIKIELVDGLYVVTLPKNTEGQADFKLVATITSPGGQTATVEYNRVLAQSFGMITEPVIGNAYKLALLHGNEKAVVYFDGNNYNSYAWYLSYTTDVLSAVDVYLEAVEGVEGGYRLYFDKDGVKTYVRLYQDSRAGYEKVGTLELTTSVPSEYYTYSTEYNTFIWTNANGYESYFGSSGTYKSISASSISHINDATSYPVRLYGVGGIEEKLPEQVLPEVPENYTSKDIVEALYKLESGQTLDGPYEITGVITSFKYAYDPAYNNISPVIVVDGMTTKPVLCYRLVGGEELKVGDTITVFAGITNYGGTYETTSGGVIRNIVPGTGEDTPPAGGDNDTSTAEGILNTLYGLADGETVTGSFTLTGKITALDSFNNPTIVVEGFESKPVYCFKLVVTDKSVGDTITVTATTMKNFGGTYEFMNCTLVTGGSGTVTPPTTSYGAPVADTAYKFALEQKTLNKTLYFNGTVNADGRMETTEDLASAAEIFFETADGGYHIYVLVDGVKNYINTAPYLRDDGNIRCRLALADAPNCVWKFDTTLGIFEAYAELSGKNDTFFFGTYSDFNTISLSGAYYRPQITSGTQYPARLVLSDGTTPPAGENPPAGDGEGSGTVTPPPAGDEDGVFTIPEVLASAAGVNVIVKGTVCEIYQSWNDQYSNISFYIKDEAGNKLLAYRCKGTKVVVGDVVTITGTTTLYNSAIQIAEGCTVVIDEKHVCSTFTEGSCTVDSYCTVCGALGTEAPGHNYVNGTCTVCNGAQPQGDVLPSNLTFTNLANNASADTYLKTNFPEWKITGKLGNGYGGYLGFGRSGDYDSAITSSDMSVSKAFTVTAVLKGNGSQGVATSTLTFTLVDADGNTIATGYADGSTTAAITPVDAKDTTYNISFTFVEGKTWTDVSNLVVTFDKVTGNIGMKSLTFVQ